MTCAPAAIAALATSGWKVSTEIDRAQAVQGAHHRHHAVDLLVDRDRRARRELRPADVDESAPWSTAARAAATAASSANVEPRS